MSEYCAAEGKQGFEQYADAIAYLERKNAKQGKDRMYGEIYSCPSCGNFHVTQRTFTLSKKKGRGKTRRGLVGIPR
jgi:hypothetical protein